MVTRNLSGYCHAFQVLAAGLVILGAASLSCPNTGAAKGKAVRLFDGKTFTGWEGKLNIFRLEDHSIVGGSLKTPLERNEFLCTKREYTDFVLRLKFKLLGTAKANAGV